MARLTRSAFAGAVTNSAGFARSLSQRMGEPGWLILALAVYGIQEFGISQLDPGGPAAILRRALFFSTTLLVIALALHFRRYAGAWLVAGGIFLNASAMAAHGGLMPIAWETLRDSGQFPQVTQAEIGGQVGNSKDIVLWREDIRLEPLSDRFVLALPGYGANVYSAGDFVVFAGLILALAQAAVVLALPQRKPAPGSSPA